MASHQYFLTEKFSVVQFKQHCMAVASPERILHPYIHAYTQTHTCERERESEKKKEADTQRKAGAEARDHTAQSQP